MSVWNFLRSVLRQNLARPAVAQPRFCSTQAIDDMPDPSIENPYVKERRQCILCKYDITVDYKNVRLLSQFVSPYTGRIYDKHITGLCEQQHRAVKREVQRSMRFGLMSPYYVDPKYNQDPRLFDPTRPQRPNPY